MEIQPASDSFAGVCVAPREEATPLPEHLIELKGGRWALWRWVGLRAAGFPAELALKLSAPHCAAAADRLEEAERAAELSRQNAISVIDRELAAIRSRDEWRESRTREQLLRALKRLKSGKLPQAPTGETTVDDAVESHRVACEIVDTTLRDFRQAYKDAVGDASKEIRKALDNRRFREAIIWQNRHAFNRISHTIRRESSESTSRNSDRRRDEELIASYLQRYCVKNDTIGFFGPVGWARLSSHGEAVTTLPGPDTIESRTVYFESWGIKSLAEKIAGNKEALPWISPRRVPYVHVEGTALHLPSARPTMLTEKQSAALRACDGRQLARDIAATLRDNPKLGFRSDEDVYKALEGLVARGLVVWDFNLPSVPNSEIVLRRLLERIEPERLRGPALASLDTLEKARASVACAAGDPERLDLALGELEETFTQLTNVASTRAHGQMYAARTLVYEDCRRGVQVDIGPEVLNALGPPLSLLLTCARWVSHKLAEMYRNALSEIYSSLTRQSGSSAVDAASVWMRLQPLLFGENQERPVDGLEPLLQERWARVLKIPLGRRRVHYTTESLRALVDEVFAAPRPGWMAARQHSPDLMIDAASAEAVRRGEFLLTIGELHLAANTLGAASFLSQHPAPDDFWRALEHDFPEPRPIPIKPGSWPTATVRTAVALTSPKDLYIEFAHDSAPPDTANAIPIADMVFDNVEGRLMMRARDGRVGFDALEAIGEALSLLAVNAMKILPPARHNPRVTIDRLVICRESWNFFNSELGFVDEKEESVRFLAARNWAKSHGMPRFVFVKVPTETKPLYLDFDSPIYVDIFAKVIRKMAGQPRSDKPIAVTEMLPAPDRLWLPDAEGRRYTSELRMVAVDMDHLTGGGDK
jgi:hypothetical protein